MWGLLRDARQQLLGFLRFCGSAWPRPPIMPTSPHHYVSGPPGHAPAEALARCLASRAEPLACRVLRNAEPHARCVAFPVVSALVVAGQLKCMASVATAAVRTT